MPPLDSIAGFDTFFKRHDEALRLDATVASTLTNASHPIGIQVICAFPVSGQYGPGSRVLYYVLVAACVFAHNVEWLRKACLAAALLLPIVAGVHGVVLAANHLDAAVDMDVYGAFQVCAIGVLAAPITVRLSRTYNEHRGRNIIFVWSSFVLAGLLSLTVEFYRSRTFLCQFDDDHNPISSDPNKFPYGNATCGVVCDPDRGPESPLRQGSANNINLIPAPTILTFRTATLLAAACCIPAILLLVSIWIKTPTARMNEALADPDSTSEAKVRGRAQRLLRAFRGYPEVLPFGAAVLAILIVGERNLFSKQVDWNTEPIANIGQWAPIAGTGFAVLGSIYIILAEAMSREREPDSPTIEPMRKRIESNKRTPLRPIARALLTISDRIEAHVPKFLNDFRSGPATDFPETPGEGLRNPELNHIKKDYSVYNPPRESDVHSETGLSRHRSRTSFTGTITSDNGRESGSRERKTRPRRDTLEVPATMHRPNTLGSRPSADETRPSPESMTTPSIVVSRELDQREEPEDTGKEDPT